MAERKCGEGTVLWMGKNVAKHSHHKRTKAERKKKKHNLLISLEFQSMSLDFSSQEVEESKYCHMESTVNVSGERFSLGKMLSIPFRSVDRPLARFLRNLPMSTCHPFVRARVCVCVENQFLAAFQQSLANGEMDFRFNELWLAIWPCFIHESSSRRRPAVVVQSSSMLPPQLLRVCACMCVFGKNK